VTHFIHQVLDFFASLGYFGVALGLMIEVIPSEIVLSYAGFLIAQGHINFWGAMIAGIIGGTIAQIFLYWIGAYGGRAFIQKYGKYILINNSHLTIAEKWFDKYGVGVIFTARFIPVVRHAISIPAGIARMSLSKFTFYTVLAMIPWAYMFILIGENLGKNWDKAKSIIAPYSPYIMLGAVILLLVYLLVMRRFKKK
jgi:membrane protein DedA with SNARE-associated domain